MIVLDCDQASLGPAAPLNKGPTFFDASIDRKVVVGLFNHMVNYEAQLDAIFTALAHPARRAMLARLGKGEATVGELAQPLEMSLPAVTKHLKVLERARLISRSKNAQWRPCRLEEAPLKTASAWIEAQRKVWESRLDRLEDYLHRMEEGRNDDKGRKGSR